MGPSFRWGDETGFRVPLTTTVHCGSVDFKMNDQAKINDTRKAELLGTVVEHIDIKSFDARPIVDAMKKMSFTSRDLGRAAEIHDDDTLRSLYIDRIYDTYIDEEKLQETDHTIGDIANSLEPKPYSSRAFIREMGKWLMTHGKKENSLVKLAYEHDVPIFCPAFVDSSAGFGLVKHQVDRMKEGKPYMVLDAIADFRELTDIKIKAGTTGLLMIGGGVPKNFAQDTVVCAEILGHDDVEVHK